VRQLKLYLLPALASFFVIFSPLAVGHGGGVDNNGCHSDAKSGQRHCHDRQSSPQSRPAQGGNITAPGRAATSFKATANSVTIAIQKELVRLGYFPGNTVGYADDRTIIAIKHFQQDIGLTPTGVRNQELLKLLQLHYSSH